MPDKKVRLKDGSDVLYPQIRIEDVNNLQANIDNKAPLSGSITSPKQLSSQDLNTYNSTSHCGWYYAAGGNSVENKPTGVQHFGLAIFRSASGYVCQLIIDDVTAKMHYRIYKSEAWTKWYDVYNKDNVDSLLSNKADSSTLTNHINNKSNPHNVTASQVGTYTKDEIDKKITKYVKVNINIELNATTQTTFTLTEQDIEVITNSPSETVLVIVDNTDTEFILHPLMSNEISSNGMINYVLMIAGSGETNIVNIQLATAVVLVQAKTGQITITVFNLYSKPSTGIPKTDLASSVQTSLNKADTALQPTDALSNPIHVKSTGVNYYIDNGYSIGINLGKKFDISNFAYKEGMESVFMAKINSNSGYNFPLRTIIKNLENRLTKIDTHINTSSVYYMLTIKIVYETVTTDSDNKIQIVFTTDNSSNYSYILYTGLRFPYQTGGCGTYVIMPSIIFNGNVAIMNFQSGTGLANVNKAIINMYTTIDDTSTSVNIPALDYHGTNTNSTYNSVVIQFAQDDESKLSSSCAAQVYFSIKTVNVISPNGNILYSGGNSYND